MLPELVPTPALEDFPENIRSQMALFLPPPDDASLSLPESNSLTYISEYIVKAITKKMSICTECEHKLTCDKGGVLNSNYDFIVEKNYFDAKQGLVLPSSLLVDFVKEMEFEYVKVIDHLMPKVGIKRALISTFLELPAIKGLCCQTCSVQYAIVHLMVNVRLHHTIVLSFRPVLYIFI